MSLELINKYACKDDEIIDVGCGASLLVDNLIEQEYKNITLLDTSNTSLDIVKKRVANNASIPTYICSDVLDFKSDKQFNIWHDRAVFHFLLNKKDREKYFEILQNSLASDGTAIISTFAIGSDKQCAGLDIVQYDYEKMLQELP